MKIESLINAKAGNSTIYLTEGVQGLIYRKRLAVI